MNDLIAGWSFGKLPGTIGQLLLTLSSAALRLISRGSLPDAAGAIGKKKAVLSHGPSSGRKRP
jgi:hypothetical protein